MGIWKNIHRLRALPAVDQAVQAGKSILGPDRAERVTEKARARLVTVPIEFEGHEFSFTAPPDVAGKAQAKGVENVICRTLAHHLTAGDVVVDVGANYGYISMVAASVVGSGGVVVAVEAEEPIYQILEATAARNHPQVICINATVGDGDGSYTPGETGELGHLSTSERLDDLINPDQINALAIGSDGAAPATAESGGSEGGANGRPITAIKIDTDGDDFAVLRGMADIVQRDHPLVVVELAAQQGEIVEWLAEHYSHVVDMHGETVDGAPWPPNVFAWNQPIQVQRRKH